MEIDVLEWYDMVWSPIPIFMMAVPFWRLLDHNVFWVSPVIPAAWQESNSTQKVPVTPKKVPVEVNVSKEVKESSTLSQKEAKEDQGWGGRVGPPNSVGWVGG